MDNTIVAFPQNGLWNGNKIAKLSTIKRGAISTKYYNQLSEMEREAQNKQVTESNTVQNNPTNNSLGNIEVVDFGSNYSFSGTRKLKVNNLVKVKCTEYYDKNHSVAATPAPEEPQIPMTPANPEPEEEKAADTRISRLERTGELNKIDLKETDIPTNNIINTPERFQEKEAVNPYESLINDNNISNTNTPPLTREAVRADDTRTQEQNMGGDPNLYTKLVHGKDDALGDDEVSVKLQDAINKLGIANEEREQAKAVNASLEKEVASVREALEKLKQEKDAQQQKALANTLNMLKEAKADILDETRKYDNLQEELKYLIEQRDALLKNPFINNDDNGYYSDEDKGYSGRRAA